MRRNFTSKTQSMFSCLLQLCKASKFGPTLCQTHVKPNARAFTCTLRMKNYVQYSFLWSSKTPNFNQKQCFRFKSQKNQDTIKLFVLFCINKVAFEIFLQLRVTNGIIFVVLQCLIWFFLLSSMRNIFYCYLVIKQHVN